MGGQSQMPLPRLLQLLLQLQGHYYYCYDYFFYDCWHLRFERDTIITYR